jgi:hypothetical protein
MLDSVKVLISKDNKQDYRDIYIKQITITAIKYISSNNKYLNLMII